MGHARGEHSQRGQLFGLDDAAAHLMALDELADLGAQVGHHFQDGVVGVPGLVTEELEDAQTVASEQDGDGEGRVQAFVPGDRMTGRVGVAGKLGDPDRSGNAPRRVRADRCPRSREISCVRASNRGTCNVGRRQSVAQRSRCV